MQALHRGSLKAREFAGTRRLRSALALVGVAVALAAVAVAAVGALARAASRSPSQRRSAGAASGWSAPSALGACAIPQVPQVVFPSDSPTAPTGPGAIVWAAPGPGCSGSPASAAHATWRLAVAPLGASDQAAAPSTRALWGAAPGALAAVGGSFGRVTVAAALQAAGAPARGTVALLQARAMQPLGTPALLGGHGGSLGLARAYLGDVSIATVVRGPAIAVRVQRYFAHAFGPAQLIPIPPGRVSALTTTMDYRSDVLVAWEQGGFIYAHMLRASGRSEATQRLGASSPDPQLRALVSDDNRGIVVWSSTTAEGSAEAHTRIYTDISSTGVRFGTPARLASFADPQRVGYSCCSIQLVRLSSENVMLAWTDSEHGHYVVRAAAAVLAARGPTALVSGAEDQAVLAGLAAGPDGDAVALWSASLDDRSGLDPKATELWAARTYLQPDDRVVLRAPERVASMGANVGPAAAVDPSNDRAVAAWMTDPAKPSVVYASSLPATAPLGLVGQRMGRRQVVRRRALWRR